MLFGLKTWQRDRRREERLRALRVTRGVFAWFPAQLRDGRWAWLQMVERTGWPSVFGGNRYTYDLPVKRAG